MNTLVKKPKKRLPVDNYFRVDGKVFTFNGACPESTIRAMSDARRAGASLDASITLYRVPAVPGPWSRFGIIGQPSPAPSATG